MVKTSRKNLKKRNKYNSKKINQKAGASNNDKHVIYLGYTNHYLEDNTYNYLKEQLKIEDSNQGKSTSILFSMITSDLFLDDEITTLKSRNTINNLISCIKLVEDKFNAGLLYRQNKDSEKEQEYKTNRLEPLPPVETTQPNYQSAGSNLDQLFNSLSVSNSFEPKVSNLQQHFNVDPLYEEIFNNPLHGIKQMQDGKNLHLIMFLMPNNTINQYDLDSLSSVVTNNSGDYFIVLFPCLKTDKKPKKKYVLLKTTVEEERDNTLGMKPYVRRMTEVIGLKKEKTDFDFIDSENYNYGVYTKNLDSNFDLQIIPQKEHAVAPLQVSPPSTPSTPSSSPNTSTAIPPQDNLLRRFAALKGRPQIPTRPPKPTPKSFSNLTAYNPYFQIIEVDNNGDCFFDSVCRCLGTINDNENGEIKTLKERFGSTNTDDEKIKALRELFVNSFTGETFTEFYDEMINVSVSDPGEITHQEAYRDDVVFSREEYFPINVHQGKIEKYKRNNNIVDNQTLSKSDFREYLITNHFWANERVINVLRQQTKVEIIIIEDKDLKVASCYGNTYEEKLTNPLGFITIVYMIPKEITSKSGDKIKTGGHYVPLFYENKGFFKTANDVPDLIKNLILRNNKDGGCVSFNLASYFNS
jgi:hypothetical protein